MSNETEFKTTVIRCPICKTVQQANVLQCEDYPFLMFAHQCVNCRYNIDAKSWRVVGEGMEAG